MQTILPQPERTRSRSRHRAVSRTTVCAAIVNCVGLLLLQPREAVAQNNLYTNTASFAVSGRSGASGVPEQKFQATDFAQTFNTTSTPATVLYSHQQTTDSSNGSGWGFARVGISATADHGVLGVNYQGLVEARTLLDSIASSYGQVTSGRVQARWQDTLVLQGNEPGRLTTIVAKLDINGGITGGTLANPNPPDFSGGGFTEMGMFLLATGNGLNILGIGPLGTIWAIDITNASVGASPQPLHIDAPASATVTMIIPDGTPYVLDYSILVEGKASATINLVSKPKFISAEWDAEFSHTLRWGGVTSVTDTLTGLPLENWSITSASGIDYAVAMPEPMPEPSSISFQVQGQAICVKIPWAEVHGTTSGRWQVQESSNLSEWSAPVDFFQEEAFGVVRRPLGIRGFFRLAWAGD